MGRKQSGYVWIRLVVKSRGRCFVELDDSNNIIRIFKNQGLACASEAYDRGKVFEYPRKEAVESIRKQVMGRAKNLCERCGNRLTWRTGEMDERISRGSGGEQSLVNCWWLCPGCHRLDESAEHGDRRWGGQKDLKFDD
jgi:hypothetical protein